MKTFHQAKSAFYLAAALALAVPATAGAESNDNEQWNQGQAELQKNLRPGQPADAYRRKLEQMGYKITATNYDNPDYVEYEVVRGDQTWEIQIDVDEDTRRATKVDVAANVWRTDETDQVLESNTRRASTDDSYADGRQRAAVRNNQYSDRDRRSAEQLVQEIESLPMGRDKQFYKDMLQRRGYDISRVDKDDQDELDLEAVKDGRSVEVDIDFDEDTGKSTEIDASTMWVESESTTRTREAQTGERSRSTQQRTSDTERRSQAGTQQEDR